MMFHVMDLLRVDPLSKVFGGWFAFDYSRQQAD